MTSDERRATRAKARERLNGFDSVPETSQILETENGSFVECWLWVPKRDEGAEA